MRINVDLSRRAVVETAKAPWISSPLPGVLRKMLERDGEEIARATSLVRYEGGSAFNTHRHDLGEEILVLEGVFSDESGHYPAGAYIRNPPGSHHAPFSEDGCTLFVKLRQFAPGDMARVVVDTHTRGWGAGKVPGVEAMALHEHRAERVYLVRWKAGAEYPFHAHPGGEEIYVLDGALEDEFGRYPTGCWLRQPAGSAHGPISSAGCLLYVKVGHLAQG